MWKLDRLSHSLHHVLILMDRLAGVDAEFRNLPEAINTTTPAGRMMMRIVGAVPEFERTLLKERTKVGLEAARHEDRIGRRRPALSPQQQTEIVTMASRDGKTAADAARLFRVHPATVSGRLLALAGATR